MTNLQLLLAIGIPSVLIIMSWINNNQRLSRLEAGLDAVNRRIDAIYRRIEEVYLRIEQGRADNHKDALEIMRSMTALHERVAVVESKQNE